jgi:hypothetical protein
MAHLPVRLSSYEEILCHDCNIVSLYEVRAIDGYERACILVQL